MTHFDLVTTDGELWRDLIAHEMAELNIKEAYLLTAEEYKFLKDKADKPVPSVPSVPPVPDVPSPIVEKLRDALVVVQKNVNYLCGAFNAPNSLVAGRMEINGIINAALSESEPPLAATTTHK